MSTHLDTDPWASTDHDPTSAGGPTIHRAHITTGHALVLARADLHEALAHGADLRRQYALSAGEYARMVLGAPDATTSQRELAGYYLIDAQILANN